MRSLPRRRALPRARRTRFLLSLRSLLASILAAASALPFLTSPAAGADVRIRGLLDLVASNRGVALESNWFNYGDSDFDAYRLRFFAEGAANDRLEVFTQFLYTDAAPARALGAYISYAPSPDRDLHLWAGKVPWIVGTFPPRSYSNKNPLVSTPLMYQYHTTLRADQIVPTVDDLLSKAGRGQYGVSYVPGSGNLKGLSVVYELCWDFGVAAIGSLRPLEFAIGATNGTPGRMNSAQDENDGKNFLGRVGFSPFPALRIGASGSIGPYVASKLNPLLPPGKSAEDYDQRLVMADAEVLFGHAELRGEAYRNFWDTPYTGTLLVEGYYAEAKYGLPWGLYAAGRYEVMDFGEVTSGAGVRRPWDYPRTRWEAGLGARLSRGVLLKAIYQRFEYEVYQTGGGYDENPYNLYAAQLGVGF